MLISNLMKKLQKMRYSLLAKKTEDGVIDFYDCVQKVFWVNFLHFFQQIRTQHRILHFMRKKI
jgi:hypothetical protein